MYRHGSYICMGLMKGAGYLGTVNEIAEKLGQITPFTGMVDE